MAGHSHRSSVKNGHKSFKSKHASKGALKKMYKGKIENKQVCGKNQKVVTKLERKHVAKQLRQNKVLKALKVRKLFQGANRAEKIVTVIPLTMDINASDIVRKLIECSCAVSDDHLSLFKDARAFVADFHIEKFKSTLKMIVPDMSNFVSIIDAAKVADYVVFGLSGTSEVDPEFGEQIIRVLELQGIASYMGVVTNLSAVHAKEKFQLDVKQSLESYFKHFFPSEDRIYNLEKCSEALNVVRNLCQKYPSCVKWRDGRGYMVADSVNYLDSSGDSGNLVIGGTVRGIGFDVNRLVHLPGLGDFQISKIERNATDVNVDNMFLPDNSQDTLDEFALEDQEMDIYSDKDEFEYDNLTCARYDDHGFLPNKEESVQKHRIPKGTSGYQARWYLDDVLNFSDGEVEDKDFQTVPEEDTEMTYDIEMNNEDADYIRSLNENDGMDSVDDLFEELSPEEEERQLIEYRAMESEDLEFPDEIELDPNESAIERLKRYRGLKNLHNCVWDFNEKDPYAPAEWKRILRMGNYKNIKNKIKKDSKAGVQVTAGDRIKLYIRFPKTLFSSIANPHSLTFAVYSLLPHEHKQVIANLSIQRWEGFEKPVASGDPLIVQYGIRRYTIRPQFSTTSNAANNVHKFERFLHHNKLSIATCILPLDFTQSPAVYFRPTAEDSKCLKLVGYGTFLNADHTRILAKRVILTGNPFKFHKKVVTVRYMFFRPKDVEWFKSIPLFTKSGRTGFIKESLGTHGYFKATFDGKLSAQDTVAMSLFRRVWPHASVPWAY